MMDVKGYEGGDDTLRETSVLNINSGKQANLL
jgi:hypothetical protein